MTSINDELVELDRVCEKTMSEVADINSSLDLSDTKLDEVAVDFDDEPVLD